MISPRPRAGPAGQDSISRRNTTIQTKTLKKVAVLVVLAALVVVFFQMGWHRLLSFEGLKARQAELEAYTEENLALVLLVFSAAYVVVAAAQLPGAAIMSLAAGVLFGVVLGTVVVSFASTLGATAAMLISRYLFRDMVEKRYGRQLDKINQGIERDGAFYLFSLRLIPIFPFWLINLLAGPTGMRVWTYMWVSQLGMLAGTIVYVNAGTQLGQLESPAGILSPGLLGSFVLLGLFPLIARRVLDFVKTRRQGGSS